MGYLSFIGRMPKKRNTEAIDRQIDENLRRVYDEALSEEVPDKFRDLIAKLRSGEVKPDDN